MKLKEILKELTKDEIFDTYTKLEENFKEFEEIDKEEMIEEIENIYKNYENIIELCTCNELDYLEEILKKKKNFIIDLEIDTSLNNKFLLFYQDEERIVPKDLENNIKKAIKKMNREKKIAVDGLNDALIGLIKIYGIIPKEKIYEILKKHLDIREEVILYQLENSRYIKFFTYKIEIEEKEYFIFEPFYYFEKGLKNTLNLYPEMDYKDITIEDMIEHRLHIFDFRKESIQNFAMEIEKNKFDPTELFLKIIEYSVLDYKRDDLMTYVNNIKELKKEEKENLKKIMDKAMNDMPSAALKGNTPNDLNQKALEQEFEKQYQKTVKSTKEMEDIQDYKMIREETEGMLEDCAIYLMKEYQNEINKLNQVAMKNGIFYEMEDSNILSNLIHFRTLKEKDQPLFSKYVEKGINVASKKYKIAWQVEENTIESLFKVKKLNPKEGTVELVDTKTKKEYKIYDLAFSSGSKNIVNSFIYTTLLTVNKFTFANGYAFIFIKELHKNLEKEIEDMKKEIKDVENEQTKEFFACHKLFKKEEVVFTAKPLE